MSEPNRGNKHKIRLIKINEPFSPQIVFGLSYPQPKADRSQINKDNNSLTGREQTTETIDIPLPIREQTILSYRVNPSIRAMLNGMAPMEQSRTTPAFRQDIDISISSTMPNAGTVQHGQTTATASTLRAEKVPRSSSVTSNPITGRYLG